MTKTNQKYEITNDNCDSYGYYTMAQILRGFGRRFRREQYELTVSGPEGGIVGFIDPETGKFGDSA